MSDLNVIGIDLAKNIFQVYGEDKHENKLFNRRLKRATFKEFMMNLEPYLVGMEACGTAHYWGREIEAMGHRVKLINPKKVKAYVERNKTDAKDAEAICDAAKSRKVRAVPVKTLAQQELTMLHRARSQVVKRRTQLVNHLRSQLAEYGIVTRQGYAGLRQLVTEVLGGEHIHFSHSTGLFVISDLKQEWDELDQRVKAYDVEVRRIAKENKSAKKLMQVPGVGAITATAIVAKVDNFAVFETGRDYAAWLGLTPREYSSAEKRRLGGISKQGDRYIRTLLVHGARSAMRSVLNKDKKETSYHRWIHQLVERVGKNKAVVALANKHARMIWALMAHGRELNLNFSERFLKAA
jgi:transposase